MPGLDRQAITEPYGLAWCRAWSDQVDAALAALLGGTRGVAVVALGSYARQELCPSSDIDLLLLHDGWDRSGLSGLVGRLCYPLWDAGLEVGHAVHTPSEAAATAAGRIDSATAALDRRLVAGDRGLLDALASRVQRWSRRQGGALIAELASVDAARHGTAGDGPGMLEPDLKDGAGGLRDIHSLRWAAAWLLGEPGLDPLVASGYLGADDRHVLASANATLLGARCALHCVQPRQRGRRANVLALDTQDDAARILAEIRPDIADADALLREVGLALRSVAHVHARTWPVLLRDAGGRRHRRRPQERAVGPGLALADGLVHLNDGPMTAATAWQALATAAAHDTHLDRFTAARLQRWVRARPGLQWDAASRAALLQLLAAPNGVAGAMADADHIGLLVAAVPGWGRVRGLPQRNPLHRYDVDTHGTLAVALLQQLVAAPPLRQVWEGLPDRSALLLATWLHDVGKAWPGDHSRTGAGVARRWLLHMGFASDVADRVARLVRWHLLLPDVATRRDLDDPREIAVVTSRVPDVRTLDELYLLALADARATGPAAWSSWSDSLLATLYGRARAALDGGRRPATDPFIAALTAGAPPSGVQVLRTTAPADYGRTADARQIAEHARLLLSPPSGRELRAAVRVGEVPDTSVISVIAEDRSGLVSDCAAVFSANDLQVLQARAVTTSDGIALDWFTVCGVVDEPRLLADLAAVVSGATQIHELRRAPRRRPAGLRRPATELAVRVTVRPSAVEVEAGDSPGLLFRLCDAIDAAGYAVRAARIRTLADAVYDVFDVEPRGDADPTLLHERLLLAASTD